MKRYLLAILLILAFSNSSYAEDLSDEPVSNVHDVIFRSSLTNIIPDVNGGSYSGFDDYAFDDRGRTYKEIDPDNMPLFKQIRLKISNKTLELGQKNSEVEKEPLSKRLKFWSKKGNQAQDGADESVLNSENELLNSIQNEITSEVSEDTLSLEGGINEQVTEKQLTLDADDIIFDEETGDIVANGRPLLYLPPQNVKIIADKMTYNEDSNILKAIGNVIIYKDGTPTKGDYLEVDLNEETMIMDNVEALSATMNMSAEKAVQKDGLLILHDGNFHSEDSNVYRMMSRMIGPRFHNMIVSEEAQALFFGDPTGNKITLDIDNLYVEAKRNHDVIKAKNIKVYHKNRLVLKWPSFTAYTNKERDYFEANYPEFGTKRKVGMFVGPGFVFGGPGGSVIKAIPFLNYNHKFGFGGALKYMNTYNRTELGYGSANEIFFLKGIQRLDDNLFLQYASNTYMDEWFLGSRMPKYMAEVYYDKKFVHKNFLADGMDLQFRHRFGFGLMEDNDRNFYGEKINSSGISTTRTRYMAELRQHLYNYTNEEKRLTFDVSMAMQGSAAVYGTGDTQFVARFGPRAHMQYKNWMQDIGYFIAGYSDESPIPRYDRYRYGHQSIYLSEAFRLNKYLSVGWAGNINLSNDAPNGKMFQENAFMVSIGPDDLKVTLGYDFVRQTTYFGFNVAFDTKGTTVNYGKMEIKNPERLGKRVQDDERKLAFAPAQQKSTNVPVSSKKSKSVEKPKVLEYAEVIEIEDPNKETIQ
ncbi:LPS-assembly protein LptD [bacterium]|nr:LPS-assembly protein LptD [bacterium]